MPLDLIVAPSSAFSLKKGTKVDLTGQKQSHIRPLQNQKKNKLYRLPFYFNCTHTKCLPVNQFKKGFVVIAHSAGLFVIQSLMALGGPLTPRILYRHQGLDKRDAIRLVKMQN